MVDDIAPPKLKKVGRKRTKKVSSKSDLLKRAKRSAKRIVETQNKKVEKAQQQLISAQRSAKNKKESLKKIENALSGKEELLEINPAVKICRETGINVSYARSADTAFNSDQLKETDVYLAMYHDQALPVLKALSFGKAVNITLGAPLVRTSVDHGTHCPGKP